MVAEMSNHTTKFIWSKMPYARALKFRTGWFRKRGIECAHPQNRPSPLTRLL